MYQLSKKTEGETMTRKPISGPKLVRGHLKLIAIPPEQHEQLTALKKDDESYHSVIQRLITYYRNNRG